MIEPIRPQRNADSIQLPNRHAGRRLVEPLRDERVPARDRIAACATALGEEYGAFEKPGCLLLFVAADPSLPPDLNVLVSTFLREWLDAPALVVEPAAAMQAVAAVQGAITLSRILGDRSISNDAISRFASSLTELR